MTWLRKAFSALLLFILGGVPAFAQERFPSKPITIITPITAGTTIDILARLFADGLSKKLGQQVLVLNRPGAGGIIAAQALLNAPADGHTIILVNSGHVILGSLNKQLPFDPLNDFVGISLVGIAPSILNVAPSLGVKNLREFVDLAKAKPGTVHYGSAGIGTATHLAGAYFGLQSGIEMVHVPYTVSSTIIADLLGGRIQASFAPAAFTLPLLQDGKLLGLAVAADEPIADPVQIPTAVSQNIDYKFATWYGLLASAKTPKPILQALNEAIAEVGSDPETQAKVRVQGITPQRIGLADFDSYIRKDMERLAPVMRSIAADK
jgi:tripartite-type tricarboxylate transporter receptor subunit TctC